MPTPASATASAAKLPSTSERDAIQNHVLTRNGRGSREEDNSPRSGPDSSFRSRSGVEAILSCIKSAIEHCDPELVADLVDQGVVLTGGGALLRGLDVFLSEQLNVPVRVDSDPLTTVARGTAICLDHLAEWRDSLDAGDGDV